MNHKIAVAKWSGFLLSVPMEERTNELCEMACKKNGLMLRYVPKEALTVELCELAVKENGQALSFVPKKMRTEEMCWKACLEGGRRCHWTTIIGAVPSEHQEKLRTWMIASTV
jgi:hypothetical protein